MLRARSLTYLLLAIIALGCGGKKDGPAAETGITIKGDRAVWATLGAVNYMKADSSMRIQVTGGGSGTGNSDRRNAPTYPRRINARSRTP